jgi:uncharacterized protein YukE
MATTTELLADLTSASDAVQRKDWLSAGLSGAGAALDVLGSAASPLSALGGAGLGWFTQFVSFLEEPLGQLRGNPGSVSSSAQGFDGAGQQVASLARSYRQSTGTETSDWSGSAASAYRNSGAQHADGIAALGQASTTVASAIAGAGEVVAQAIEIVTQLVTEAVAKIIPIMTQAVAAAPATFGQSIAAAIPQCVQIAVEYGQKILEKLAALLASGQNLLKLVQGAQAVVQTVKEVLTQISQQSTQGQGSTDQPAVSTSTRPSDFAGLSTPAGFHNAGSAGFDSPLSRVAPQSVNGYPSLRSGSSVTTGLSAAHGSSPGTVIGGFGPGGAKDESVSHRSLGPGASITGMNGKEVTAARPSASTSRGAAPSTFGSPMGAHPAQGEEDKEHQRRFALADRDGLFGPDESAMVAPQVIGGDDDD